MASFFQPLKQRTLRLFQLVMKRIARKKLQNHEQLWQALTDYQAKTKAAGCSYSDYWELYKAVRSRKPKEILECGPGISTILMAYALMENDREGYHGRITAVEELEVYYKMAIELLPEYLNPYVEFVLSPRIEDHYSLFRGVRYRDVPNRPYDFVFVDGPDFVAPSDGVLTFDLDYIHTVKNSKKPVYGIVDCRLSTVYVLQAVFGLDKVKYSAVHVLGFVGPCTKDDLTQLKLETIMNAVRKNANFFGNTEIKLR